MSLGTGLRVFAFCLPAISAGGQSRSDSTQAASPPRPIVRLTTRLLSQGAFYYTGRIISKNPALDFFFVYERKGWGFSFFKAFDLYDHLTGNNFSLGLLYKTFHIGRRLTVTPNVGFDFEQNHSLADKGSDVTVIVTTAFRVSKNITVDNSSFFSNLVLESGTHDWTNRFRLLYTSPHFDVTVYAWHNNHVLDHNNYFSTGINATYARMRIARTLRLSTGVSALTMVESSDEMLYPKRKGIILTLTLIGG
jgi:hypothetical protein